MSRRAGQYGSIEKCVARNQYRVRFRVDVEGASKRQHKSKFICPIRGLGTMTASERSRRAMEIVTEHRANSATQFQKIEAVNSSVTFRIQAKWWLQHAKVRTRRPIQYSTDVSWSNIVENWLIPNFGDMPLASVNNSTGKRLVELMLAKGRGAKTVHNVLGVMKLIVKSAVDSEGLQLYPREWNHEFMELPIVEPDEQHTPTHQDDEVSNIIAKAEAGRDKMFYVLKGGTGVRASELFGLEIKHLKDDCTTLRIEQKVIRGKLIYRTKNGRKRDIDIHPEVASLLKTHIGSRTSGFVFENEDGGPVDQRNFLGRSLHPILAKLGLPKSGFHTFRRFRNSFLRSEQVPDHLINYWIGHYQKSMIEVYDKLKENVKYRKEWANKLPVGFTLPAPSEVFVPRVPQNEGLAHVEQALAA